MIVLLFIVAFLEFCTGVLVLLFAGSVFHFIAAILLIGFAFVHLGLATLITATRELYPAIQLQGRLSSAHPVPRSRLEHGNF